MHASQNDAVKLITARFGRANYAATAGAGSDNSQQDGAWINRRGFTSCKVIVNWTATLAQGATLSLAAAFQDATDGSGTGAGTYGSTVASVVVATGPSGGGTVTGVTEYDLDLASARAFVRARITSDLSASGTDTSAYTITYVLGGAADNPVSLSAI